ncbi:MAG: cytochrome c oxidase subunit II [Halobacteriaceae archaeon]
MFQEIFWVFLGLGTLVGVVVVGYMVYNAYAYRADGDEEEEAAAVERPDLGELPTGSGGGKKLLLSFSMSAIVVVSLIAWTYGALLAVEAGGPAQSGDALVVHVEGYQFGWRFTYPDGTQTNELRLPADRPVRLVVTSADVFHNFGIPGLRVKTDAIPGHTTDTWVVPEETGTYTAHCYELCGVGHSYMTATVRVVEPSAFDEWYSSTNGTRNASEASA